MAEAYIQLRDFESAETVLESIVKQRPNDVEALVYLEKVYRNLNRLSDSIGLLQRISKLDPSHAQSRLQEMAQLSMELHRGTDALKYARLVLDLNPNDWKAAERLGDVHVRLGQWADALFAYQRSLANAPQNVPLKFKLAGVLERLGRHDALMEMLSNIVENAMDQNDVLSAGRKLIGNADLSVMPNLEQLLLDQIYRKRRKRIYRKLLVELYRLWVRLTSNHSTTSSSETLEHIGRRGLKPLLDSLQEADLSGRTKVLKILMATRNHLAALPLIRLLQTSDKLLRFQVLVTLAHIGTRRNMGSTAFSFPIIPRLQAAKMRVCLGPAVKRLSACLNPAFELRRPNANAWRLLFVDQLLLAFGTRTRSASARGSLMAPAAQIAALATIASVSCSAF